LSLGENWTGARIDNLIDTLNKYERKLSDKQRIIKELIEKVENLYKLRHENDIKLSLAKEQRNQDMSLIMKLEQDKRDLENKLKDALEQFVIIIEDIKLVYIDVIQAETQLRQYADEARNALNQKNREIERLKEEVRMLKNEIDRKNGEIGRKGQVECLILQILCSFCFPFCIPFCISFFYFLFNVAN